MATLSTPNKTQKADKIISFAVYSKDFDLVKKIANEHYEGKMSPFVREALCYYLENVFCK